LWQQQISRKNLPSVGEGKILARRAVAVGVDIGTTHVRVVIGELTTDGNLNIIGVGTSPSRGLKKGVIVDLEKTVEAIQQAVDEAERMAGLEISSAFLGIVGSQVGIINNRGIVAVSGSGQGDQPEDVERVLQAARVIALPPEMEIIDVVPREFIVDGHDGIKNPIGMTGVRLEVDAMLVCGSSSSTRNALRCVKTAGLEVDGLVLHSLANAEILLS
jgi:cell division protein FtsA